MNLLLDTQIFIWYLQGEQRLTPAWRSLIQSQQNQCFVSVISIWEAIIKSALGKLKLDGPAETFLPEQRALHGFRTLELQEQDLSKLAALPLHHRDPFDRMLVAQAIHHDLTLVTSDAALAAYPVKILS